MSVADARYRVILTTRRYAEGLGDRVAEDRALDHLEAEVLREYADNYEAMITHHGVDREYWFIKSLRAKAEEIEKRHNG